MTFNEYHALAEEKAGQRLEKSAVRYFYDNNVPLMDCVLKLTYRRA